MKIKAKKIRIEFNNSSEDFWEATCGSGIEFDEAIRMITRAWEEHDASAEPLIKDEKIRKAVRAWADANDIDSSFYDDKKVKFNSSEQRLTWIDTSIEFDEFIGLENLKNGRKYTISELCGEEEAPEPIEPTFVDLDERIKEKEG